MTDPKKLDLNLVVVLDALLAERNLTRAGERVGMTQPAVSGALTRLREIYEDPLLVRDGRGFVLTAKADGLVAPVAECVAEVQRTFEVLPAFDPATSRRTFFLSASDYVLSEITSPLLGVLAQEAPHTRVAFGSLPMEATLTPVDLLRTDLVIVSTGRGVPGKRASLFSDRFVCVTASDNPALVDGALELRDLAELPHVRSVFGVNASTQVDDMLADAGISPRAAITVEGFLAVPVAVSGSNRVGWVPERTAQRYAKPFGLTIARTPVEPSVLVEAAHWHPSKTADPALQWLVRMLRKTAELVEFGMADGEDD